MKMLSATQQTQEEVERTKQQLSFEVDRIKQDADMKVGAALLQEHGYVVKIYMLNAVVAVVRRAEV